MNRFAKYTLLAAALGVFDVPSLRADTFFSNLSQNTEYGFLDYTTQRLATDFLTGTAATTITNATLIMYNSDIVDHTFTLSLFTDSGSGTPGTLVGSFDAVTIRDLGNYSFTSAGITLAADTAYWAVMQVNEDVSDPDADAGALILTRSQTPDAGGVFSIISGTQVQFSADSGADWSDFLDGNFKFSLSGAVVPEPASFALVGAGLFGLYVLRRQRA